MVPIAPRSRPTMPPATARRREMSIQLKHPLGSYQPRLTRFLEKLVKVRSLKPRDIHLWQIMDSVAFQDTETALDTTLYNEITKNERKSAGK